MTSTRPLRPTTFRVDAPGPSGVISSAVASDSSGCSPGRIMATVHSASRKRGTTPARTRLDLPQPDGPTIATNASRCTWSTMSSISCVLPKKSAASDSSKGRRPLYGFTPVQAPIPRDPAPGPPHASFHAPTNRSTSELPGPSLLATPVCVGSRARTAAVGTSGRSWRRISARSWYSLSRAARPASMPQTSEASAVQSDALVRAFEPDMDVGNTGWSAR